MFYTWNKMETAILYSIIIGVIPGLSNGSGVLPDGPLNASVGGAVMFTTNLNPTETPFQFISWDFDSSSGLKPIVLSIASGTTPEPEYEGRITLFLSTGSLELRNLTLNDSGNYIFSFRASGEALKTEQTTLHIYEPVSNVRVSPLSADLIEFNSSVHLFCSSSGSSLSFIWTKDNSELTASDRVQINKNEENSTLTIANVIRNDKGLYRCHVSNPASSIISVPVNISVSYGPEKVTFSKEPPSQKYPEGSDIHLSCSADSRPNAIFNWFFNGNVLPGSGSQRELLNVQKNQSGNYSCQAFNTRTSRYQTSQILVIYIEDITTEESNPLPPGAIAGIAIACVVCVSLIVFGVYFILKKNRKRGKTSNRNISTDGNRRVNAANTNEEVNYADVKFSKKNVQAQWESDHPSPTYADIRVNRN